MKNLNVNAWSVNELSLKESTNINGGDYGGKNDTGNGLIYFCEAMGTLFGAIGAGISKLAKSGAHQSHGK
jgi:hypothetical protein